MGHPTQPIPANRWLPLVVISCLLGAWEVAARLGWLSPFFFPAPSLVVATVATMAMDGTLGGALGITLYRLFAGLALGACAGLVVGWLMGASRRARSALDPIVAALHPLPKLALFPLFLVVLGLGESSRVALIALSSFFPMLLSVVAGVTQTDEAFREVARSHGASWSLVLRRVILPGSLPMALTGLRLSFNSALVIVVAVEMVSLQRGLGASVWLAWQTMRIRELYAILVVISALGLGFNALLGGLSRLLVPWRTDHAS